MKIRCASRAVSRPSPVRTARRQPSSLVSPAAVGLRTLIVSAAKGTQMCTSSCSSWRCQDSGAERMSGVAEKLSERVASHTRHVPLLKGKSCISLDRQPSPLFRPARSLTLKPCAANCPLQHVFQAGVTRVAAGPPGAGEPIVALCQRGIGRAGRDASHTVTPSAQSHRYGRCRRPRGGPGWRQSM